MEVRRLKGEPLREETEPETAYRIVPRTFPRHTFLTLGIRLHYYRALTRQKACCR